MGFGPSILWESVITMFFSHFAFCLVHLVNLLQALSVPANTHLSAITTSALGLNTSRHYTEEMLLELPNHDASLHITYAPTREYEIDDDSFKMMSEFMQSSLDARTKEFGDRTPMRYCINMKTIGCYFIARKYTTPQRRIVRLTYGMLLEAFDVYYAWVQETGHYDAAIVEIHLGSVAYQGLKVGEILASPRPIPETLSQDCGSGLKRMANLFGVASD